MTCTYSSGLNDWTGLSTESRPVPTRRRSRWRSLTEFDWHGQTLMMLSLRVVHDIWCQMHHIVNVLGKSSESLSVKLEPESV